MRRRKRILLFVALGAIPFLLISSVLARAWSAESAERDEVTALIQSEARGDVAAMLDRIHGCRASAACTQRVEQEAAALGHGRLPAYVLAPNPHVEDYAPVRRCGEIRLCGVAIHGVLFPIACSHAIT